MSIIKLSPYILDSTLDFTFNNVTATGNLSTLNANLGNAATANYFIGNGSLLTGLPASYANTNVANYLPTFTGNLAAGNISVSGDATITGNLTVSGTTTTINSTVVTINDTNIVLANNATTSAQANGAGITINGASANLLYINSTNSFTFSHKISADGSLLSNIAGANVTGQVANALIATTVTASAQPNITSHGTLVNLTVSGNVALSGANVSLGAAANLKITGGTASQYLQTDGTGNLSWATVTGGSGSTTLSSLTDVSVTTPLNNQILLYNTSSSKWFNSNINISTPFVMTDDVFNGDGANTVFTLSVTPASTLYTVVAIGGVVQPRSYYSISGNVLTFSSAPPIAPISITTFGGNAALVGTATTVVANAQPNITSTGTLTSLTVTGNIIGGTDLYVGNGASSTSFTNPIAIFKDNGLTYVQAAIVNSTGTGSADIVTYGNNGDDTQSWTDMGFTGNSFSDANYTVTSAGDGYLFVQGNSSFGGNLVIATGNVGTTKDIIFATGGFLTGNIKARLYNANGTFSVTGNVTGANIIGNHYGAGNNLSNIQGANISGAVAYATTANSVAGANVSGIVSSATTAATVTTAAQSNITSVGALTSLSVTGLATFQSTSDVLNNKTGATGTVSHDLTSGGVFYHTSPAANFTANFTNVSTTDSRVMMVTLLVAQGSTAYIPNAVQIDGTSQTIKWAGGTAPTGNASKLDIFTFSLLRNSSTWIVMGQGSTYG